MKFRVVNLVKVHFDTQSGSYVCIPGVNRINNKTVVLNSVETEPGYHFINCFSHEETVKFYGKVIDMKPYQISEFDIYGKKEAQYLFQKGYKYKTEFKEAVTHTPSDVGFKYYEKHHEIIDKVVALNYDSNGTFQIDNFTEIVIKYLGL